MLHVVATKADSPENHFLYLYKMVQEREPFLNNEAKIIQYGAILRYFIKFLQAGEVYSPQVMSVLYWVNIKLGDIYYEDALQKQDNQRYFLATAYYNQALLYAKSVDEKNRVLLVLKDIYYYLGDEEALVKVEETWAENHNKEEKFAAYVLLAQNAGELAVKAKFLEKALAEVMAQDETFYMKYQDTLDILSKLSAVYELSGEGEKAVRVKKLRENTLKLLN